MIPMVDNSIAQRSMVAAYSNMQKLPREPLERQNGTEETVHSQSSGKPAPAEDQYIEDRAYEVLPAQSSGASGLYSVKRNPQGAQEISFQRPARYEKQIALKLLSSMPEVSAEQRQSPETEKPSADSTPAAPAASKGASAPEEEKTEQTTADTDRVDNEIKNLKAKHAQLKKRLLASSDPEKRGELQNELRRLESELSMKDNDSYRRQNTSFTTN